MALRLRRDVQKASYYVWFLGAEEAKGLRGHRVINSVLPYLIDRSRTQEPIKVTLQVSHKGIKIIQVSLLFSFIIYLFFLNYLYWFLGLFKTFYTTQCHNKFRTNGRYSSLRFVTI